MEGSEDFNIELISKSLNDIQAEKTRNERLLHTENSRRSNCEFELQTNYQKRKDIEKKHQETIKELATLRNKCITLDRHYDEIMDEHNSYRDEIDSMKKEENRNEMEHKQTMVSHYKLLDEILSKFRNTKSVLFSELREKSRRDVAKEVSLLEAEFDAKQSAIEKMQMLIELYEQKNDQFREKEELLKEDYANMQVMLAYFNQELDHSKKCEINSPLIP